MYVLFKTGVVLLIVGLCRQSDELVILDTISDPVSETFAIIIAKYFIAQDLRNSFINDSNKLYRFWKHIKDFFPSGFESPSVQMNDIHEIEVENKLIKMNDKTSREVFFVRSKGGDSASRQSKVKLHSPFFDYFVILTSNRLSPCA